MQTHRYFQGTIIKLFLTINLSLSKPLRDTLSELIVCLLENNKAHISKIGETLSLNSVSVMACIQRIRRFLSNEKISPSKTLIPLILLLRPILKKLPEIILIIDRTDWEKRGKHINILSVAISYKGRGIPLCGQFWERRGAVHTINGNLC